MTAIERALKRARLGDDTGCLCIPSAGKLLLRYTSSNLGTRQAMKALLHGLNPWQLSATDQGKIQVALVEVLNNIVKHAYSNQGSGIIEITCQPFPGHLGFEITDSGIPLPAHCLTNDHMSAVDIQASLPEGGFGWFLIRQLSYDITHERHKGKNICILKFGWKTHQRSLLKCTASRPTYASTVEFFNLPNKVTQWSLWTQCFNNITSVL